MIKLWPSDDPHVYTEGDYAGDGNGVAWMYTSYSESLCSEHCNDDYCHLAHPEECIVCDERIRDTWHMVCLDGGDSAHRDCVYIHRDYPHTDGTLPDCHACDPDGTIWP